MICPSRLGTDDFPKVLEDGDRQRRRRFFARPARDAFDRAGGLVLFFGKPPRWSTLTQQLARTMFLKKEDSLERKLLEAVLAVRNSQRSCRSRTFFTRYMNVVPLARNMYGFDDPARFYFGVHVKDLTLPEAALLVGMLPKPNNRDPKKNPGAALKSALGVIDLMLAQNKITAEAAEEGREELKRRIAGGRLRRGNDFYKRLEYRPYRDLALRETQASKSDLAADYRLVVYIDAEFQSRLAAPICAIAGKHHAAGVFVRPHPEKF